MATVAIGLASETDSAFAVSGAKLRAIGLAVEFDQAFAVLITGGASAELLEVTYSEDESGEIEEWQYRVVNLDSVDLTARPREAADSTGWMQGTAHPRLAGIQVIRRAASFQRDAAGYLQKDKGIATITFGAPSADAAKNGGATGLGLFSASLESYTETVFEDRDGEPMVVRYQSSLRIDSKRAVAERQAAAVTYTLTKGFPAPRYSDNALRSMVNQSAFGPVGARGLLFRGVEFEEDPDGTYLHRYVFSESLDEWRFRSWITFGGVLPDDATEEFDPVEQPGGIGVFHIQEQADFAALPVRFPSGA